MRFQSIPLALALFQLAAYVASQECTGQSCWLASVTGSTEAEFRLHDGQRPKGGTAKGNQCIKQNLETLEESIPRGLKKALTKRHRQRCPGQKRPSRCRRQVYPGLEDPPPVQTSLGLDSAPPAQTSLGLDPSPPSQASPGVESLPPSQTSLGLGDAGSSSAFPGLGDAGLAQPSPGLVGPPPSQASLGLETAPSQSVPEIIDPAPMQTAPILDPTPTPAPPELVDPMFGLTSPGLNSAGQEAPEVPETPEAPKAPTAPTAPEGTETSELPEESEVSEAPGPEASSPEVPEQALTEPAPEITTAGIANSTDGCFPYSMMFARGTTEGGLLGGTVGPLLANALGPDWYVEGVAYAADVDGIECLGMPGGVQCKTQIEELVDRCPDTSIVLAGYSQGAMVARVCAAYANDNAKENIAGLALFGDPFNGASVKGISYHDIRTWCDPNDAVCSGYDTISAAHLAYERPGSKSVPQAVSWVKDLVGDE